MTMASEIDNKAKLLLANFGTAIFHSLACKDTAQYASDRCGDRREKFITPSVGGQVELWDRISGGHKSSFSVSERYEPILRPVAFLSGLRRGGPINEYKIDGIVIKSGEPFLSTNENWLLVEFSQK
jgi:hypothetical protein